jgi:hypothetical protein
LKILNVKTNSSTFEVFYDDVSENILAEMLNLQKTTFPAESEKEELISLDNEKKILAHYEKLGFTHINDPDSMMNPYTITEHIDYINDRLKLFTRC